ncbi:MAG TPA: 2-amino-4-hydroxy-6-hydroxymethyldihydropteridine diphosphokinase [Candidatus Sulfotelmatobacter sp.]|jgi:2-amino-4-hydroxy-6-hydroxymethyldihydropteridine diphosphokinase|nr:2-amino-4-hydroxy-6-hydroxymethyldihydropteridine diphosphokinase [Candidatus Sulfotelmatobacter sp.]
MRGAAELQATTRHNSLILIGLGANLPSRFGDPRQTLQAALKRLQDLGLEVTARSRYWLTAPVPVSDQPWFHNAVCAVKTGLPPDELLALLHKVEAEFGRVRTVVNAPRVLDLDLLAYGDEVVEAERGLVIPHPRLAERAFVLFPIRDVAPDWLHPVTGEGLEAMIARIPADQHARPEEQG